MSDVPTLKPTQCRYMRKEDVERYNRLADFFRSCRETLEQLVPPEVTLQFAQRLAKIAVTMKIDRFCIGFVGPSQVGKSFSVANFLGVTKLDSPTPEGGRGNATTSAPTRIRRAAPHLNGKPQITLFFMTADEFSNRVRNILEKFHLDDSRDVTLPTYTDDHRKLLADTVAIQSSVKPGDADTHRYLVRLIQSAISFRNRLAADAKNRVSIVGNYSERRSYVADENPQSNENEYLLLREAVVDFSHPDAAQAHRLPEDLEIIDLPGLGTTRKCDDEVTRDFLPDLHGAFVFQHCGQLTDGAVGLLLNILYDQFSDQLKGRIWYVVTKMDALNESATPEKGETILHSIQKRIEVYRLNGESDVLLLGNVNYQEFLKHKKITKQPGNPNDQGWRLAEDGTPEPLPHMRTPPRLGELYAGVLRDGGVPLFQKTATELVRDSVKLQTQLDVERSLTSVRDDLAQLLDSAFERAGMPMKSILACSAWAAEIQRKRERIIQRDFDFVEGVSWELQDELEKFVLQLLQGNKIAQPKMAEAHRGLTQKLMALAQHCAADSASDSKQLVRKAFDGAINKLQKIKEVEAIQKNPIQHGPIKSPVEACQQRLSDRWQSASRWTKEVFIAFDDEFPDIGSLNQSSTYLAVMQEKVAIVARCFGMRLLTEINCEIKHVEDSLKSLAGNSDQFHQADREVLQQLIHKVKAL